MANLKNKCKKKKVKIKHKLRNVQANAVSCVLFIFNYFFLFCVSRLFFFVPFVVVTCPSLILFDTGQIIKKNKLCVTFPTH